MSELQVWYNGSDHVIAENAEDAEKVWEETTGDSWQLYDADGESWEIDNKKYFNIAYEEQEDRDANSPKSAEKRFEHGNYYAKASREEWIKITGRGWLCSENW